jgi:UDP-N-acetylmuramoyl-L-alanyl-D-glutamate--2,6-diaminopimelate ligase
MKLQELAELFRIARLEGDGNTEVTGIEMDSRKVKPGDLFVCVSEIPGLMRDGHPYAADAAERGAAAVVAEHDVDANVPKLFVNDSRRALAVIAAHFYGYPSHGMKVIGVTGTNGKTTTTFLIERILRDQGFTTGLMGNLGIKIGDAYVEQEGKNNTRDVPDLQRALRSMRDASVEYCVMEATSVGLEFGRVLGCNFRTALFTNLTQDHLETHKTMENYRAAKGLLFSRLGNSLGPRREDRKFAVLNADDPASDYYRKLTYAEVITYGIDRPADVRAAEIRLTNSGTSFAVRTTFAGSAQIEMKLLGRFNVYNALGAIAAALAEEVPLENIRRSLAGMDVVAGRMEVVDAGQDFLVVVDYAHTPDGLENALSTISEFAEGRILCVFGCGGDRDRTKRPVMGGIAAKYSDYVIVTSDNPRTEDPEAILQEIEPGIREAGFPQEQYELIVDRRAAIQKAVEMASPKDVVLIAGKGHETYQLIGGKTLHFDDREEAKEAIRRRKD